MLKVFINTQLAEPFTERETQIEASALIARREDWGESAPEEVLFVTVGVDVQQDWLAAEMVGWGIGEESWSLDYREFRSSTPDMPDVWRELDAWLNAGFPSKWGINLQVACTFVDSGGKHTQSVYEYCRTRLIRRVFPIKGHSHNGKPIVGNPSRNNRHKLPLFMIGTDTAKERIFSRLHRSELGTGYCHFPKNRDQEYFDGLLSESLTTKVRGGVTQQVWEKTRNRNEPLDCRVYALAAFTLAAPRLEQEREAIRQKANPAPKRPEKKDPNWLPDTKNDWL